MSAYSSKDSRGKKARTLVSEVGGEKYGSSSSRYNFFDQVKDDCECLDDNTTLLKSSDCFLSAEGKDEKKKQSSSFFSAFFFTSEEDDFDETTNRFFVPLFEEE